jgi:hypothetical protein
VEIGIGPVQVFIESLKAGDLVRELDVERLVNWQSIFLGDIQISNHAYYLSR